MPKTKALGNAEELVREITNASLDAIYVKDTQSRWLYANPSLERIAGKPISELLNKTDIEIYSNPEIGRTILEHDKKVMESGKAETFEESADLPDGRHFFISVKSPRLDEKGNVIGIVGISHDITNRKKREEQLKENQQKYKALIETSSDFIWEMDPQGHYTYCSPQMETLWGLKPSEMIGKTPFDQMPPEAKEKGLEIFSGFAASQKRFSGVQVPSLDGKGNLIFIEISGVPFFDKECKLLGFRGVTRDITEHKKNEEALRQSRERMDFALQASHLGAWDLDLIDHTAFRSLEHDMIFGYKELMPQWTYEMFLEHVIPEDRDLVNSKFKQAIESKSDWNFECRIRRPDGAVRWIWASGHHRFDENGTARRMAGVVQDITDRKKVEEDLKASEEQFRRAIEDAPIPVIMHAEDGQVLQISRAWTKLTGYSLDVIPTFDSWISKAVYGEGADAVRDHMHELFKGTKQSIGIEFPIRTLGGSIRYWSFSASSPGTLRDGRRFIVGMAVDITERQKAEEALRESEERFKAIASSTPDHLLVQDNELRYIMVLNPQLGLAEKDMIDKTDYDILSKEHADKLTKIKRQVLESGETVTVEMPLISKKGVQEFFSGSYVPKYGTNGKVDGLIGYFRNVTERKKTEETLKESEQLYKTIFDNRDDGFVLVEPIYDEDHNACDIRFLQINLAYEQQTGTKAAKVEGKRAKEVAPNLEQEWISICGEVAKTGRTRRFESYNQRTNKWYDANYIPFARGRVGILFRDVTERKNLENQLQDKERLAAIGATAGMVGHDIRNPLQAITSDVFLAKSELSSVPDGSAKEGIKESLEGIQSNVDYINKIVQDLQDYARPLAPAAREIDLETLCEDILFKNGVPENINASCQVEKRAKSIVTDPEMLKRILSNLVNNAIQATPDCGKIAIHAYQEAGNTVITVQDTGAGIPEDVKPKLFTPLFTTKSKGQGFGLAVVKRMTEALGGTVSFESKVGEGTKFIVSLPPKKAAS